MAKTQGYQSIHPDQASSPCPLINVLPGRSCGNSVHIARLTAAFFMGPPRAIATAIKNHVPPLKTIAIGLSSQIENALHAKNVGPLVGRMPCSLKLTQWRGRSFGCDRFAPFHSWQDLHSSIQQRLFRPSKGGIEF